METLWKEYRDNMEQAQTKMTEKIGNVDIKINRLTEQINVNQGRIEEINQ